MNNIPGAVNAAPAHPVNDRNGTDWWVEHASGKHLSVDCKIREKDWTTKAQPEDDLALETWSVVERQVIGWTRNGDKRTDYILWLWLDTGRWCLMPFPMLCRVFSENWRAWIMRYKTSQQFTPGPWLSQRMRVRAQARSMGTDLSDFRREVKDRAGGYRQCGAQSAKNAKGVSPQHNPMGEIHYG